MARSEMTAVSPSYVMETVLPVLRERRAGYRPTQLAARMGVSKQLAWAWLQQLVKGGYCRKYRRGQAVWYRVPKGESDCF
jgi:predicted transcriptional regulator